jgi:hypothetical protein
VPRWCDDEKRKLPSEGDSGSKKFKLGYNGASGGVWWSLGLAGLWRLESGGLFCIDAFGRNLALVAVEMFSYLMWFKRKCCTFSVICNDNAKINYFIV